MCFNVFTKPLVTAGRHVLTQVFPNASVFFYWGIFVLSHLLTGNEVLFSLETASDYVKDEKACFYGFKCVAVGYEFNPGPDEVQQLWCAPHWPSDCVYRVCC